jgi:hypothetical protein
VDLGSSTGEFRTKLQPWIDADIFAPLRERGGRVIHVDLKAAPGVDMVGDLLDPPFFASLSDTHPRSVMVSNLLEHVTRPDVLARRMVDLLPPGGHLIVTGPTEFPKHPDPIDLMFRPSATEAATYFPGTTVEDSAQLDVGTFTDDLRRRGILFRTLVRLCVPSHDTRDWLRLMKLTPYLIRHYNQFALVLRKTEPAPVA